MILFTPYNITHVRASEDQELIQLFFFYSSECEECDYIEENILDGLESQYPITIKAYDIVDHYEYLLKMEKLYGHSETEIPAIFIGNNVLSGKQEIIENLYTLIEDIVRSGSLTNFPTPPFDEPNNKDAAISGTINIYMAFFTKQGCQKCSRAYYDLQYLQNKYPTLVVKKFNIDTTSQENKLLNEAMGELYSLPENKRLVAPSVFIGDDYLVGSDVTLKNMETLIHAYAQKSSLPPWEKIKGMESEAKKNIITRFKGLNLPTIIFAGLLDGINPCAFVTIIFFISYLQYIGRRGVEILLVGSAFSLAVFVTYLLVGVGVLSFVRSLKFLPLLSRIIYMLTAIFVIILGILSLKDYFICRRGDIEDMKLQLPDFLKKMIHKTIRKKTRIRRYVIGALSAGFIVSFLELACTGQVYLPTIIFASRVAHLRLQGLAYLFLYNLMFILPLIIVFITAYIGTSSEQLTEILQRHVASVKLATSLLFFSLGIILILTLFL
ncbi:MAG: cytochrome c biogenesis CcdA family protein [bacterium]